MEGMARLFKALADETRVRIMALILEHGELCVCDCMYILQISQSKASRHLRYLANAGLLRPRRDAVWMYYDVPKEPDPDRDKLLDSLRGWITPERDPEIAVRVKKWLELKANGQLSCSVDA